MSSKLEILQAAENVKPVAEVNGIEYVSFEDFETKRAAAIIDDEPSFGKVKFNEDGSVGQSRVDFAAVNIDRMYQNRMRYLEDESGKPIAMQIVIDPQAIQTQTSGSVYASRITAYEITREGKNLVLKAVTTVSDDEFVREFKKTLAVRDMETVMPLIQNAGSDISTENIAI